MATGYGHRAVVGAIVAVDDVDALDATESMHRDRDAIHKVDARSR